MLRPIAIFCQAAQRPLKRRIVAVRDGSHRSCRGSPSGYPTCRRSLPPDASTDIVSRRGGFEGLYSNPFYADID